jgi:hypothetical protein
MSQRGAQILLAILGLGSIACVGSACVFTWLECWRGMVECAISSAATGVGAGICSILPGHDYDAPPRFHW